LGAFSFLYLRSLRMPQFSAIALACLLPALAASAQSFDATHLPQPEGINNTWLVNVGDDPAYARPDFDDSHWTRFDPRSNIKQLLGNNHPAILWYRTRIKVNPTQTGLTFREQSISRAFELYANGQRLIAEGSIDPFTPYTWNAIVLQPIPDRMLASGSIVIALRVHISPMEWLDSGPGYSAGNLQIGQQVTLVRDNWLAIIGDQAFTWLDHLLTVGLGLVALVLFAAQRRQTEYLWIAALGLLTLIESIEPFLAAFHNLPLHWEAFSDLFRLATPFIWTSLYFSFVHQRIGWRWRGFLVFAGIMNAFSGVQGLYFSIPVVLQFFTNLPFIILLSVVVPVTLGIHWRRGNREAGILLIPAVLFSIYIYVEIACDVLTQIPGSHELGLRGLTFIDHYPAGPFSLSLDNFSSILSTFALAVIMLLRSSSMSRRQAILEGELSAAQEVQRVLIPEQAECMAGFLVETVYEPAQQVGGDFFQIVAAGRGDLLVVVGDVAGKGLPAAMLVSVLVGAIRGVAGYTSEPAEVLANLNERLVGRGGGSFSTALVAHITAHGQVRVSNAGHLPPYLDGQELDLPGALPLGVMSGSRYETAEFHLAPGSRLTFYSDGVVEAQNHLGELFGFDRAQQIAMHPAADIVAAAKQFGQEDDITVVTIERDAVVATAA
jgi:phosphoserine phosphatase RsbU/P